MLEDDAGAEDAVEEQIAAQFAVRIANGDDDAFQAEFSGNGSGQAAMIGLRSADGDNGRRLRIEGFDHQIL